MADSQSIVVNNGFADPVDTTKQVQFIMSGLPTATQAQVTVPNANGTMAYGPGASGGGNFLVESAGSTTPSVAALVPYPVGVLSLANTGTYTITQFTGGVVGQVIVVINNNTGTITVDRSNSYLDGGVNQTLTQHDAIVLAQTSANVWKQIGKLCVNS